jgi:leucyl-tRNA synthetase
MMDDYRPCAALNALSRLVQHVRGLRQRMGDQPEGSPLACAFTEGIVAVLQLVAPIAPHLAEELWETIGGGDEPLASGGWPA